MKHYEDSWAAGYVAKDLKPPAKIYKYMEQEKERPCVCCGKVVRMYQKQKYCTACSMKKPSERKKMMEVG